MRLSVALTLLLLCSCSMLASRPSALPMFAGSPAQLAPGAWAQQLRFEQGSTQHSFDALLEIDAASVRLVAFSGQQEAFRLTWDGVTLHVQQADWVPPQFDARWVLNDLQLALWPLGVLRGALPSGWSLDEQAGLRTLRDGAHWRVRVQSSEAGMLIEHADGFRLKVTSSALEPDS